MTTIIILVVLALIGSAAVRNGSAQTYACPMCGGPSNHKNYPCGHCDHPY